jgi:hypothetical protein
MTANRPVGTCAYCTRIAIAALGCPCGAKFAHCAVCFQTAIRASLAHVADCDRMERAVEPAPVALVRAGVLS